MKPLSGQRYQLFEVLNNQFYSAKCPVGSVVPGRFTQYGAVEIRCGKEYLNFVLDREVKYVGVGIIKKVK